jgi:hypothetical protein
VSVDDSRGTLPSSGVGQAARCTGDETGGASHGGVLSASRGAFQYYHVRFWESVLSRAGPPIR